MEIEDLLSFIYKASMPFFVRYEDDEYINFKNIDRVSILGEHMDIFMNNGKKHAVEKEYQDRIKELIKDHGG